MGVSHRPMAPPPILHPTARLTARFGPDRLLDSDEVLVEESASAGVVVLAEAGVVVLAEVGVEECGNSAGNLD